MRKPTLALAFALALFLLAPPAARAAVVEGVTLSPSLSVGGRTLDLRGCGVRRIFLFDVYVAGLYLPRADMRPWEIMAPETAKAVRLHIIYDGDLPRDMPDSWRDPLEAMARVDIQRTIADIYAGFESGDRVTLAYTPDGGTTVEVNGEMVRSTDNDDLMRPLLELWIGDRAVSPNLRQLMLSGRCGAREDEGWL